MTLEMNRKVAIPLESKITSHFAHQVLILLLLDSMATSALLQNDDDTNLPCNSHLNVNGQVVRSFAASNINCYNVYLSNLKIVVGGRWKLFVIVVVPVYFFMLCGDDGGVGFGFWVDDDDEWYVFWDSVPMRSSPMSLSYMFLLQFKMFWQVNFPSHAVVLRRSHSVVIAVIS